MSFSLAQLTFGTGLLASVVVISPALDDHLSLSWRDRATPDAGFSSSAPGDTSAAPRTRVQPDATLDDQVDLAITVYNSNIAGTLVGHHF